MFRYAQLSDENIVIGISQLNGEVNAENMIKIDDLDVELGSTYDRNTNTFTPPIPVPVEPQPTLEEKLARMEQQLQEQALVQLEVLATIYEELLMKG